MGASSRAAAPAACEDAPVDRRTFLGLTVAAVGVTGLGGCTDSRPAPLPSGAATSVPPSDDDQVRAATFAAEAELVALYATAIASAEPGLAERLRGIQAQHVAHADRLRPGEPVPTAAPTTASPTPVTATMGASEAPEGDSGAATGQPSPSDTLPAAPAVLAGLRAAEREALAQRRTACEQADDADLARALALIAASEAQHADVLRAWGQELS